jgi:hypothetical protein
MKYINSIYTPDMSGRQGGAVFSRNKYGAYIKMFKPPSNPRTPYQQAIRAFFASAARTWATLTDAQRTAWNDIAATFPFVKGGVTFFLSGFSFFVKLNRNLQDIAQPFYEDISRSTLVTPPDMSGSTVDIVTTPGLEDIKLNIPAALDANTMAIVYATPVIKSSRQPDWKKLRVIKTIDHTFISGGSIKVAYIAKFGAMPATGEKAAFAVMPVDIACGLTNSKVYTTSIGTV